jgi:hypothetical protein
LGPCHFLQPGIVPLRGIEIERILVGNYLFSLPEKDYQIFLLLLNELHDLKVLREEPLAHNKLDLKVLDEAYRLREVFLLLNL